MGTLPAQKKLNVTMRNEKLPSQADPKLLAALRALAKQDGRGFRDVLEDAIRDYLEARNQEKPRAAVAAHLQASVKKNRQLGEQLAK